VIVVEAGGRADGRWLVSRVSGSLFTVDRTIELTRAMKRLKEPAHQTTTKTTTATSTTLSSSSGAPASTTRDKIVAIARDSLSTKTGFHRYSRAGATTTDPTPPSPNRTDCSQFVRACYLQAGGPDPGLTTYQMAANGRRTTNPQPGDIMITADQGHCELYIGGGRTIGHGSEPIDYSTVDAFPGHFFVTFRM
jgi:cell wall-associated NlpC family hydrolase